MTLWTSPCAADRFDTAYACATWRQRHRNPTCDFRHSQRGQQQRRWIGPGEPSMDLVSVRVAGDCAHASRSNGSADRTTMLCSRIGLPQGPEATASTLDPMAMPNQSVSKPGFIWEPGLELRYASGQPAIPRLVPVCRTSPDRRRLCRHRLSTQNRPRFRPRARSNCRAPGS
jgi:hypothetical protein